MKEYEEFELDLVNQEVDGKFYKRTCLSASSIQFTMRNCSKGCINPTRKNCNTVNTCRTMK